MTPTHRVRVLFRSIAIFAATGGFLAAAGAAKAPTPAVLVAMKDELDRSIAAMPKGDPAAYFISRTMADRQYSEVSGSRWRVADHFRNAARWLEVQTRVGTYQLDNTQNSPTASPAGPAL